jgi:hypothetical protein
MNSIDVLFKKTHLAPGIVAYDNVMADPQAFISKIESLVLSKDLVWTPGQVGDSKGSLETKLNTKHRNVDVIGLPAYDRRAISDQPTIMLTTHLKLNKEVLPVIDDYADEFRIKEFATGENWQILKYGEGQHFGDHADDAKNYPRTFSISFYLNDDYEGGEIEFPRLGIKVKPKANQAIVFPANYVYNHIVHPVTSGVRWAVVNWFE